MCFYSLIHQQTSLHVPANIPARGIRATRSLSVSVCSQRMLCFCVLWDEPDLVYRVTVVWPLAAHTNYVENAKCSRSTRRHVSTNLDCFVCYVVIYPPRFVVQLATGEKGGGGCLFSHASSCDAMRCDAGTGMASRMYGLRSK